jgi:hypothetical protein
MHFLIANNPIMNEKDTKKRVVRKKYSLQFKDQGLERAAKEGVRDQG